METTIQVCKVFENGNELFINQKGCETIEIADVVNDINCFSIDNKQLRLIGIGKNLYKLTLNSFKSLKRELNKRGLAYRFDNLSRK